MEDQKAYIRLMHFTRAVSIVILLLNFYVFCYGFFAKLGLTHMIVVEILDQFTKAGILNHSLITKMVSFSMLSISCILVTPNQTDEITWRKTIPYLIFGPILFFGSDLLFPMGLPMIIKAVFYMILSGMGYLLLLKGGNYINRILKDNLLNDVFNEINQSFPQQERLLENEFSINIPTRYNLRGIQRKGWINIVNPFRGAMVLGTPGSGKSFVFINAYIKQLLKKKFTMYVYDFKYPDLSRITYNELRRNEHCYKIKPKFFIINFDNPKQSHRCNPLLPSLMSDISDAYESASIIMLNLNRSWVQKQGDFFVESPINFVTSIIWFLKIYKNGKYCTFPHVIEFLSSKYDEIFPILGSYDELEVYVKPFVSAYEAGATDQIEGQIASARIGLARLASPKLYWPMSGNDFSLDINNPDDPKILCVGNNPEKVGIYGAALGLYNARIVKLINKTGKLPCALIVDELATIFFKGLDQLIATARSNKVAVLLGFQDFSQLLRDYGKNEAQVIIDTITNIFVGMVKGDTARQLAEQFGKINQRKQSISTSQNGTSITCSTQMDYAIPASVMAKLSQGTFVGGIGDDKGQEIKLKVFHAEMVIDPGEIERDKKEYEDIPEFSAAQFRGKDGKDITEKVLRDNYIQIKEDVKNIISWELERISTDPTIAHLIKPKKEKA